LSERRRRDKWSLKKWYTVYASSAFGFAELGLVPALTDEHLLRRTIEVSLFDLTKDITQLPYKLKFQIVKVEGNKAYTQFKGFELTRDYIRSLVRRGSSKIDGIFDVHTKDGVHLRVMVMAITLHRAKTSQKKAIRKIMKEIVEEFAAKLDFDAFIQEAVLGKISSEIFNRAKKIYPLRKCEVRKIKVLTPTFEIPLKTPPPETEKTRATPASSASH